MGIELQLLPNVKQEIDGIFPVSHLVTVGETKALLVKAKNVQLLVVKISIEFPVLSLQPTLLEIIPYRHAHGRIAHLLEMVFDDQLEVFVDREYRHCVLGRHHFLDERGRVALLKSVTVEGRQVFLLELLYRHQQGRSVQQHSRLGISLAKKFTVQESLSQIGGHRYTALHRVRLIPHTLFTATVHYRETQRLISHTYHQPGLDHGNGRRCWINVFRHCLLV